MFLLPHPPLRQLLKNNILMERYKIFGPSL